MRDLGEQDEARENLGEKKKRVRKKKGDRRQVSRVRNFVADIQVFDLFLSI